MVAGMQRRIASQAVVAAQQRDEAMLTASASTSISDVHPLHRSPSMGPEPKTPPTLSRRRRRLSASAPPDDAPPPLTDASQAQPDEDNKGHTATLGGKTLDRLETWFGLTTEPPSLTLPSAATSRAVASDDSTGRPSARLVLQHAVAPGDTLEALALRYGLPSRTLRQANGLWPGDSVQVRKFVYIPLDACTRRDGATTDIDAIVTAAHRQEALRNQPQAPDQPPPLTARSLERKLTPQQSLPVLRPTLQRINSSTSVTSSSAASTSASTALAPKVRRVPAEALSHFPPRSRNKGKARLASRRGLGDRVGASGAEEEEEGEPGESGVDDLLRLAEKARTIGENSTAGTSSIQANREEVAAWGEDEAVLHESEQSRTFGRREASFNDTAVTRSESVASSSDAAAEEWKPNKWTFGAPSRPTRPSTTYLARSSAENEHRPAMLPGPASSSASTQYTGWNDAPEPSLAKHVRGRVSHAYDTTSGGAARRGRAKRPVVPSVLDDLAAGLPPNPGPASHWARPIGDSVPRRASKTKPALASGSGVASTAPMTSSSGWAGLLSDTFRGRIRLEEALQKGLEEVAASFEPAPAPSAALASATLARRHITAPQASERPSAEMARATLGRKAGASIREERGGEAEGESETRPLTHELERIAVSSSSSSGARYSSPAPVLLPSASLDSSSGPIGRAATMGITRDTATRRQGVRNIDWTAAVSESS